MPKVLGASTVGAVMRRFAPRLALGLALYAALLLWDGRQRSPVSPVPRAVWPLAQRDFPAALTKVAQGVIPMPKATLAAHASSLVPLPAGHPDTLWAFWFAGSKESAPDVGIAASGFARATQQWRPARFVLHRSALGRQLGFALRRLGNPVGWLDAQGRLQLFVVATGLGGWAASRIVQLRQTSAGQSLNELDFDVLRVLPLAWGWNISHLVRTAPLALQDGAMLLPAYFELGYKYPVALRFNAVGDFQGMQRISRRTHLLQPTLLALGEAHWLALLRDQRAKGYVGAAQTQDAGQHWQDLPDLVLTNPDASIAALALAPTQLWLAHNSSAHSRSVLDLSRSVDGSHWTLAQTLAQGGALAEYSYPAMTWADASLWLSYTDQRRRIAWQRFAPVRP